MRVILAVLIQIFLLDAAFAQAWRDCVPGSIGPGGCFQSDREAVNLLAQEAVNLLAQAVVNQLGRAVAKRQIATSLLGWIPIHYVLIRNRNGDRQRLTRLASDTVFSLCSGRTS